MPNFIKLMRFAHSDAIMSVKVMRILADEIEEMIEESIKKVLAPGVIKYSECAIEIDDEHHVIEDIHSYKGISARDESEVISEYTSKISQLGRRSAYLTIYGVFEYHLEELCKEIIEIVDFQVGYNDLKGGVLDKISLVLSKIIKNRPVPNKNVIEHLKSIRNTMAHNNAKIRKGDSAQTKALNELKKKDIGLSTNDFGDILLESVFLTFSIDVFETYFREIDKEINKLMSLE